MILLCLFIQITALSTVDGKVVAYHGYHWDRELYKYDHLITSLSSKRCVIKWLNSKVQLFDYICLYLSEILYSTQPQKLFLTENYSVIPLFMPEFAHGIFYFAECQTSTPGLKWLQSLRKLFKIIRGLGGDRHLATHGQTAPAYTPVFLQSSRYCKEVALFIVLIPCLHGLDGAFLISFLQA